MKAVDWRVMTLQMEYLRGFRPWSLVLIWVTLGLAGCGSRAADPLAFLRIGNGPEPESLDPHLSTGVSALNIQRALFEGLVRLGPEGAPEPGMAKEWTVSPDGLEWVFLLREGASWTDGQPVTAIDFEAAFQRATHPELGAPNSWLARGIDSISAKGSLTVVIRLEYPMPWLPDLLVHPFFSPVPAHRLDGISDREVAWIQPGLVIGNGPFKLADRFPNQFVEVVANPAYWDAAAIHLEGIRFVVLDDPATEERTFLAGQIDVTDSVPPARIHAYQKTNDERLRVDPYLGTYYFLLNHEVEVLRDLRVRKALSLAVDRRKIVDHLLGGGQRVAHGIVPDTLPGYQRKVQFPHDPQRASQLMAEAGFPMGQGFPELTYLFNSSESHRRIAEALQAMWLETLGISLRLENVEWRTYLQRRAEGDFEIARAVWIGDYPEPSTFLGLWAGGEANEWSGWSDSMYGSAVDSALRQSTLEGRMAAYAEAEAILMAAQPFIPLYHYVTAYLVAERVTGWRTNLLDWPVWSEIRLATD